MQGKTKLISVAAAYTVASAGAALGADITPTPVAPDIVADPENNFGGVYLGLGYGIMAAELGYDEYKYAGDTSGTWTAFGGYNFVHNDWVFGAEFAWWGDSGSGYEGYGITNLWDLRARVGYTFASQLPVDNILFYGTLGYWEGNYNGWGRPYSEYGGRAKGWSFGGGIEANVNRWFYVGADVNARWDTDDGNSDYSKFHAPLTTVAIRGGFRLWNPQRP